MLMTSLRGASSPDRVSLDRLGGQNSSTVQSVMHI